MEKTTRSFDQPGTSSSEPVLQEESLARGKVIFAKAGDVFIWDQQVDLL